MREQEPARPVHRATVSIGGDEYVLRSDKSPEEITTIARLVDKQLSEVMRRMPNLPRHQAAILAALNIADDAERLRKENQELLKMAEEAQ